MLCSTGLSPDWEWIGSLHTNPKCQRGRATCEREPESSCSTIPIEGKLLRFLPPRWRFAFVLPDRRPQMSLQFLNPLMLFGLAAGLLPVLVHLLSRRRHDVVAWGAMQFLALGRSERRRVRLEQLLLLLIRTGLIGLLALALARPYLSGVIGGQRFTGPRRDVVLIIDGSYSMGWEGAGESPHVRAVEFAYNLLESLQQGDTVCLIDARERPRTIIETGTRDFDRVRRALGDLPPPAGSSDLAEALFRATQLLSTGENVSREVVLLTDGQALPWHVDDSNKWRRFDALAAEQSIPPTIRVLSLGTDSDSIRTNVSVDPIQLSREAAIVGVPVALRAAIRRSGDDAPAAIEVSLEVDGLLLGSQTQEVHLSRQQESVVEFEYVPRSSGSHLVSVVTEGDDLPADDRAVAAIRVREAIPTLLFDGDPHPDPTKSETFFATAALSPQANDSPWIRATVMSPEQLASGALAGIEVAVLANVPSITDEQAGLLAGFVSRGGGLLIAVGDRVDAETYNRVLGATHSLLPSTLDKISGDPVDESQSMRISNSSLAEGWLSSLKRDTEGDFMQSRFTQAWRTQPVSGSTDTDALPISAEDEANPQSADGPAIGVHVAARLENGDPFLIERRVGRGRVLLMTVPLDADWSNLPTRSDYVTFLHEVVFHLASLDDRCNLTVGEPLLVPVAPDFEFGTHEILGPAQQTYSVDRAGTPQRPIARFADPYLPGVYTLKSRAGSEGSDRDLHFVVRSTAREWDLTPVDESSRERLSQRGRMSFFETPDELVAALFAADSGFELGHVLFLMFLLTLMGETLFTRHLVRGGHSNVEQHNSPPVEAQSPT